MRLLASAFFISLLATPVMACPDFGLWGRERYEVTGQELYRPRSIDVVAGGDIALQSCKGINPRNWSGPMPGYVISEPDFSIRVSELDGYEIEFRVESECDSTLLINTAATNWYFDDDDNSSSAADAKIRLTNPSRDGIYDVWVGTYGAGNCDAQLIVETF